MVNGILPVVSIAEAQLIETRGHSNAVGVL
jgi:hypothetical protein